MRETLFNWLGQDLAGRRCLDLCAGSGALGFEALSRGAKEVAMVERARPVVLALQRNAEVLDAGARLRIHQADALEFLGATPARFDVVFLDPPYQSGLLEPLMRALPPVLNPGALVYAEHGAVWNVEAPWTILKQSRAGTVHFYLLQRESQ